MVQLDLNSIYRWSNLPEDASPYFEILSFDDYQIHYRYMKEGDSYFMNKKDFLKYVILVRRKDNALFNDLIDKYYEI